MDSKNIQRLSVPKITDPFTTNTGLKFKGTCKRGKLDIGTQCNYNCYFCYYSGNLNKTTDFEIIKQRIDKLYELGCRDFDISGGEPFVHKDFFKIIKLLKDKGCKVSCLTNGSKPELISKAYEYGLNEILFSLHSTETRHEKITGVKGSFKKIINSIENAKKHGILIRINSTICKYNYDIVHTDYYELIKNIKPFEMNFLPLNYFENTNQNERNNYEILLENVKKFIDKNEDKIIVNVRYVPFCYMVGYEKYVKGYLQHIFEPRDWNICWYHYLPDTLENFRKQVLQNRILSYRKTDDCLKCSRFQECDGIEPLSSSKPNPF